MPTILFQDGRMTHNTPSMGLTLQTMKNIEKQFVLILDLFSLQSLTKKRHRDSSILFI